MIAFFGLMATLGAALVVLDFMAWANDPTPSMYRSGFTGFGATLICVGGVGAACVYAVP